MLDYVDKMLTDLPAEMDGKAPSTSVNHLLTVNYDQTKVDEKKAQLFHTYVAKTLRVKSCDKANYWRYPQTASIMWDRGLTRHTLSNPTWGVIQEAPCHLVEVLYMEHQKCRNSTHKYLSKKSWWGLMIKSSILLETNGLGYSGKRKRHIAVRYFFIANRVKSKEIRIDYFPTGIMIADYFTKPLQGLIFWQLWDMIMGNTDIALPTEQASVTIDQTNGIPAVLTQQEYRSMLGKEVEINPSPPPIKILSNGGPQANGSTCDMRATPGCMSCTFPLITTRGTYVEGTPALSWADVARKGQTRDRKGMGNPHSFYEI
jgi:hypothetical protein